MGQRNAASDLMSNATGLIQQIANQKATCGVLALRLDVPKGSALLTVIDESGIAYEMVAQTEGAALKGLFGRPNRDLSEAEREVLRRGGASEEELVAGPKLLAVARARTGEKYQTLVSSSLSVEAAAKRLGVTGGRIRQRLVAGELYGFKVDGDWRIPSFQFEGKKLVPGIDRVMAKVPRDLPLVALFNWLTTPNPELVPAESGEGLSPLEWLRSGYSPDAAAALAAEL